ncbi:hypothetical protein ACIRRH_30790 [Kitasatospora sp. NPDC101235]|uniref:hypothetical protein n=1 Tax=Kitasatospora sp. NPDC101235 TaxID=3364101 RepID=UPI0038142D7A
MVTPAFRMFPDTDRLRLANRATSGLVPFDVDPMASTWFVLVVAVGPNCRPLGGRAPDIELQAGDGFLTLVPQSPATAAIADETGQQVASASWTRDHADVFTVQLDISGPDMRTWAVRITNNDPEELGFVWTSAGSVTDARQPRLVLTNASVDAKVEVGVPAPDILLPFANIGTGVLTFNGPVGADLGAGFALKNVPTGVAPNACDRLVLGVSSAAVGSDLTVTVVLDCNEPVAQAKTLRLSRTELSKGKDVKEKEVKDKEKDKEVSKEHKDAKETKEDKEAPKESTPPEAMINAPAENGPSGHFIRPELRPDLSDSALRSEDPDQRPGGE